jgi:hypothetical protein
MNWIEASRSSGNHALSEKPAIPNKAMQRVKTDGGPSDRRTVGGTPAKPQKYLRYNNLSQGHPQARSWP